MEPSETAHHQATDEIVNEDSLSKMKTEQDTVTMETNLGASIVTEEMIKEEKRLEEEGNRQEEEILKKHEQLWKEMSADQQVEKYRKLQYLLTKSNMYTEYLIGRMKKQKEEKLIREEKRMKRLANKKLQEAKSNAEMEQVVKEDDKQEEEKENQSNKPEEPVENCESPQLQRRTRTRKTDSDFKYTSSQESSTSRRSGRNHATSNTTPISTSSRKLKNGTLDSFFTSSQETNSTQTGTPVRNTRKRKKMEEENSEPIDMEAFSQNSQNSLNSNKSTRSMRGKKAKVEETENIVEMAAENITMKSPKTLAQITNSPKTPNSRIPSQLKNTPKSDTPSQLKNSPRTPKLEMLSQVKDSPKTPKSQTLSQIKSSPQTPKSEAQPEHQENISENQQAGNEQSETVPEKCEENEKNTETEKQKSEEIPTEDGEDIKRIINGEEVSDIQPTLFTGGVLRQYQLDGFSWLQVLFENGINGILADEMGLGKTVQCVAIIAHLVNNGIIGPFLVVGPLSTLPNWYSEFQRFTPKVPVLLYHGSKEERAAMRNKMRRRVKIRPGVAVCPVVITSYEMAMIDKRHLNLEWRYLIVDEGHRIKNSQCRLIKDLRSYDSTHRLLLTGTPLQNNLAELWSLLNFLLPEIFDDLGSFESWFDIQNIGEESANEKIIAEEKQNNVLSMLHQILRPFMLRRLKSDVDLCIPPKKEVLVYAPMSKLQQDLYRYTVDKTILKKIQEKNHGVETIEYNEAGRPIRKSVGKVNYSLLFEDKDEADMLDGKKVKRRGRDIQKEEEELEAWVAAVEVMNDKSKNKKQQEKKSQVTVRLQNIMMQLRKCCNHPYLLEHPIDPETGDLKLDDGVIHMSGKVMVLDKMLPELKKGNHKVLIFSQMTRMLDLLEDYCVIKDYNFCRLDGSCSVQNRKEQMESFNDPNGGMFIFLLSTRAGGLGINLVGADTCIIYDSDWNPQCDLQAQDRCHRIGQTRPVVVYRFVTANTIDQKIVERAGAKRKLEKMIIHKGKFKNGITEFSTVEIKPISPEELLTLLKSEDHSSIMSGTEGSSIDQNDLDRLLDRSDLYEKWEERKRGKAKDSEKTKKPKKQKMKPEEKQKDSKFFKVVDIYDEDSRSSLESATS